MTLRVNYAEAGVRDGSSPRGGYGWKGGGTFPRTIRVKWADRFEAIRQAVGYSYGYTSGGVRYLRRELPTIVRPFDSTMRCVSASIVRGERWTGRAAYDPDTGELLSSYPNRNPTKVDDEDGVGVPNDSLMKFNEYKFALINLEYAQANYNLFSDADVDAGTYGPAGSESPEIGTSIQAGTQHSI